MSDRAMLALSAVTDENAVAVEERKTAAVPAAMVAAGVVGGPGSEPSEEEVEMTETMEAGAGPGVATETLVERVMAAFEASSSQSLAQMEALGVRRPASFFRRQLVVYQMARRGALVVVKNKGTLFEAKIDRTGLAIPPKPVAALPASEKDKAATGDEEDFYLFPERAKLIKAAIERREPIVLVGPPGCGKTSLLEKLCREIDGEEPYKMSLHGEMSVDDFFGTKELKDGKTIFRDGPVLRAMREKKKVIINEIDCAPPEILMCLQRVLEKKDVELTQLNDEEGRPLRLHPWHDEDVTIEEFVDELTKNEDGEDVIRKVSKKVTKRMQSKFCIVGTANTIGRGDDTGLYRGTNPMNEATLDRLHPIHLGYPDATQEAQILVRRTKIDPAMAQQIARVADLARKGFKEERRLNSTFSLRKTLNWARFVKYLGCSFDDAFSITVLERVTPEDRVALAEMFQRVTGRRIDTSKLC